MPKRTSVEIQAVSVDEAVRLALAELELTHDDVDIEVLSEEGPDEDAEALVRVTARGQASQPVPGAGSAAGRAEGGPDGHRRNRRRGRGGDERQNPGQGWLGGRTSPGDRPSRRGTPPLARNGTTDRIEAGHELAAKEIVSQLLLRMGVEAEVVSTDNPSSVPLGSEDPPTIFIDVQGHDLGMLIGRRGDHLSNLQYLVNTLVNRRLGDWTRVIVDIEGYRARREESLAGLAERVARQVARNGRPIILEPMPPNERRIIHLTLRSHPDVVTQSSGEGLQRHITVEPAS